MRRKEESRPHHFMVNLPTGQFTRRLRLGIRHGWGWSKTVEQGTSVLQCFVTVVHTAAGAAQIISFINFGFF